uniref:Uncharacterized protein n=1 Tax=Solanum tuberosum TaxID=4113 RepID=M1DRZ5_SOLTU
MSAFNLDISIEMQQKMMCPCKDENGNNPMHFKSMMHYSLHIIGRCPVPSMLNSRAPSSSRYVL